MSETGSTTGWGGVAVRSLPAPPSSPTKPQISRSSQNRPFLWDFRRYLSVLSVSGDHLRSLRPVWASRLCIPKFRSPRPGCNGQYRWATLAYREPFGPKRTLLCPVRDYRGFNPSASNCWLHSAGASRSRSTPMPRGKRPSTAARTRSGARNASEIVMLTWRTLHF